MSGERAVDVARAEALLRKLQEEFRTHVNGCGYSDVSDDELREWQQEIDNLLGPVTPKVRLCFVCQKPAPFYKIGQRVYGKPFREDYCAEHKTW